MEPLRRLLIGAISAARVDTPRADRALVCGLPNAGKSVRALGPR